MWSEVRCCDLLWQLALQLVKCWREIGMTLLEMQFYWVMTKTFTPFCKLKILVWTPEASIYQCWFHHRKATEHGLNKGCGSLRIMKTLLLIRQMSGIMRLFREMCMISCCGRFQQWRSSRKDKHSMHVCANDEHTNWHLTSISFAHTSTGIRILNRNFSMNFFSMTEEGMQELRRPAGTAWWKRRWALERQNFSVWSASCRI